MAGHSHPYFLHDPQLLHQRHGGAPAIMTSPFLLAKQMGTSVQMLEKFYGQTVTSSLAAEFSESKQKAADQTEKGYLFE